MLKSGMVLLGMLVLCGKGYGSDVKPDEATDGNYALARVQVVAPGDTPELVRRAREELLRYVYLLTGQWRGGPADDGGAMKIVLRTGPDARLPADGPDPSQNFALYVEDGSQVVHGASPVSTLWAAYELIESWGVGFYLGGDYLPKPETARRVALVERSHQPALAIRGNVPWCNFANSPTSWNPQDYRTFLDQMAKQKANFIGFHSYNHEPFAAYFPAENQVRYGHPLMLADTPYGRNWSPKPWGAWNGLFGTDLFFDRDSWGTEVGATMTNRFDIVRAQQQVMVDALAYARTELGMKTCMGFEVSGDSADPNEAGTFVARLKHILNIYPLDYAWIWQMEASSIRHDERKPEAEVSEEVRQHFDYLDRSAHDLHETQRMLGWMRLAYKTIKEHRPEVTMIVSGWGGEQYLKFSDYYLGLDKLLPKDVVFSALDYIDPLHVEKQPAQGRSTGFSSVPGDYISGVYGDLSPGRQRWPILWFESDGYRNADQTGPQPNVLTFQDALQDTIAKGCQGALGIHWRTRNVQDVAGYLYDFGWGSDLAAKEYLRCYARELYGDDLASDMMDVHLKLEAYGPGYTGANGMMECWSDFVWFPNQAQLPNPERVAALRALRAELLADVDKALKTGPMGAANELHDLAQTIHWLILRGETGLQIQQNKDTITGPLLKRLQQAEQRFEEGAHHEARKEALAIASELETSNFKDALPALAATCRTRGELGMLLTANQRYGRYYAEFVDRVQKLAGQEVLAYKTSWTYGEGHNSFPVPNRARVGEAVHFDTVLLPVSLYRTAVVELTPLDAPGTGNVTLPLKLMGGAYHRATFTPTQAGTWAWSIRPEVETQQNTLPWPKGVLTAVEN